MQALTRNSVTRASIRSPVTDRRLATRVGLFVGIEADNAALDIVRVVGASVALVLALVRIAGGSLDADAVLFPHPGGCGTAAVPVEGGEGCHGEEGDEVEELHVDGDAELQENVCVMAGTREE